MTALNTQHPTLESSPPAEALRWELRGAGLDNLALVSRPVREPGPGELPHGIKFKGSEGWIYVTRGKLVASQPELLSEPLQSRGLRPP